MLFDLHVKLQLQRAECEGLGAGRTVRSGGGEDLWLVSPKSMADTIKHRSKSYRIVVQTRERSDHSAFRVRAPNAVGTRVAEPFRIWDLGIEHAELAFFWCTDGGCSELVRVQS